ncbi:hypothetical protein, partial [Streptococcus sp. HMSC065C01]|uniref:hypothetical protein n=1 Tax=Streptococcus sp. HMSC065C01 TaxID=1739422 RepID=UPI001C4014FF
SSPARQTCFFRYKYFLSLSIAYCESGNILSHSFIHTLGKLPIFSLLPVSTNDKSQENME